MAAASSAATSSSTLRAPQHDPLHTERDEVADEVLGSGRHERDDARRGPESGEAPGGVGEGQIGRRAEHHEAATVHRHDPQGLPGRVGLGRDLDALTSHGGTDPGPHERELVDHHRTVVPCERLHEGCLLHRARRHGSPIRGLPLTLRGQAIPPRG